jgi:hypothetical protein
MKMMNKVGILCFTCFLTDAEQSIAQIRFINPLKIRVRLDGNGHSRHKGNTLLIAFFIRIWMRQNEPLARDE